jgi:kynureninase
VLHISHHSFPSLQEAKVTSNNTISGPNVEEITSDRCLYFCGNSLGVQPRRTSQRIQQYLRTWATQGVFGHFKSLADSPLSTWLGQDEAAAEAMAPIVGAKKEEVAVMGTLTANLHFLMCAFYKPVKEGRHKIILENKAFPSDHVRASPIPCIVECRTALIT